MSGQWIHRAKDVHHCAKPTRAEHGNDVKQGDQWQCNVCHKVYTVTGMNTGDQRDPVYPPMILWDLGFTPQIPTGPQR